MRTAATLAAAVAALLLVSPTAAASAPPNGLEAVVLLAADRLDTAPLVAAAKWHTGDPVESPEREARVLAAVERRAYELGADPASAVAVTRDQMEANKVVQRGLHAQWYAQADRRPEHAPDLAGVRAELDRITPALVEELAAAEEERTAPGCAARLARSTDETAAARGLDRLASAALSGALESVCV
ncbi:MULTISPECIES: chorismate mutase [Nocardiopsis]|uniref:Chorismate mutase n=1 Tax=Nocardiopsis dassonvillei (strain ATCC 23218 / DSM 43111 / CIP 107115 / JCM 7437 / KCTC 9190 / NBRC 14626 / NCTC 10488 / NRRL B-5397 / IMRU 509) TaxID=446468 RepID=D7B3G7_NOCDD|nr:chorismate mutase [Nocardiopsis dassonvillei]ADH66895.1 chorismate mutase [Nocardiopsis dassonvillei subsp. dassonvillei DSM 43111]NKY81505.1 chorismate mutase [Nocardiopsis dassonvillei]VEI86632.1 Secreted chorismate mutase precursor [Nocardiopsis dassonvillei]